MTARTVSAPLALLPNALTIGRLIVIPIFATIILTSDGGRSWERADAGRDRRYAWALAVDAADPDRWFVSAAPGPFAAHGSRPSDSAIYRWEGSGPWRVIEGPLDSHVYALATGRGQLFAGSGSTRSELKGRSSRRFSISISWTRTESAP